MKHKSRFLLPILTFLTFGMVTGSVVAVDYVKDEMPTEEADAAVRPGTDDSDVYLNIGHFTDGSGLGWYSQDDGQDCHFLLAQYKESGIKGGGDWINFNKLTGILGQANNDIVYVAHTNQTSWSFGFVRRNHNNQQLNWAQYNDLGYAGNSNVYEITGWGSGNFTNEAYNIYKITLSNPSHGHANSSTITDNTRTVTAGNYGYLYSHQTFNINAGKAQDGYKFSEWTVVSGTATFGDDESASTTLSGVTEDTEIQAVFVRDDTYDDGVYLSGTFNEWSTISDLIGPAVIKTVSSHTHYFWEDVYMDQYDKFVAAYIGTDSSTWFNPATSDSSINVDVYHELTVYTFYEPSDRSYQVWPQQDMWFDLEVDATDRYYMIKTRPEDFKVTIGNTTRAADSRTDTYNNENTTEFNFDDFPVGTLEALSIEVHGVTVPQSEIYSLDGANMVKINNQWYIKKAATADITVKMGVNGNYYVQITGAPASDDLFLLKNNTYSSTYHTTLNTGVYVCDSTYLTLAVNDTLKLYNAYDGTIINFSAKDAASTGNFSFVNSVFTCNTAGTYYFEIRRVSEPSGAYTKIFVDKKFFDFTFNANGMVASNMPSNQSVERLTEASNPDRTPTTTTAVFDGWYKEDTCDTVWNFDLDTVSNDTTVYAKWDNITMTATPVMDNRFGIEFTILAKYGVLYDTIVINCPDPQKSTITPISYNETEAALGNTTFTVPVNNCHMGQTITVTLKNGNTTVYSQNASIKGLLHDDVSTGDFDTDSVAVKKRKLALTYGAYAQLYFGVDTANLANSDIQVSDRSKILTAINEKVMLPELPDISKDTTVAPCFGISGIGFGSNDGLTIKYVLNLRGEPNADHLKAEVYGERASGVIHKDDEGNTILYDELHNYYYVEVIGINPTNYLSKHILRVSNKTDGSGWRQVQYDIYAYIYTVHSTPEYKDDTALYNYCKALNYFCWYFYTNQS